MTGNHDGPDMQEPVADGLRQILMKHIAEEPERRFRRNRRRLALWGGSALLVLGGAGIAGAAVLEAQTVSNAGYVTCMASPERGPNGSYPGITASIAHNNGPGRVDDAMALCRGMWSDGLFEPGYDELAIDNPPGRVPEEFQVCVMKDGSAAVVPSNNEAVCGTIGLASLTP